MTKTVKSPKGNDLPLINLKGKDYLMVAHRIQWLNEAVENFTVSTEFLSIDDTQTVARALVQVFKDGKLVKSATATKRETKQDFSDHTEKAETAAIGRALAMLGYGTQFAIADLDEGDRIADTPLKGKENVLEQQTKTVATTILHYSPNGQSVHTNTDSTTNGKRKENTTANVPVDSGAKSTRPIKELITAAFKILEAQKKITKEEFKTKYQKGQGLSSMDEKGMLVLLDQVKKDFPHLNL